MMKDITHYFTDPVKPNENGETNGGKKAEEETASKNPRGKRTRVKIRISRTSTEHRVCDIIESKNDMVDKTPSPFTDINNLSASPNNGTPKSSVFPKSSFRKNGKNKDKEETKSNGGYGLRSQMQKKSVYNETDVITSSDEEQSDLRSKSMEENNRMQVQQIKGKMQILAEVDLNHEPNDTFETRKKGRRQNNTKVSFDNKKDVTGNSSSHLKVNVLNNKKNMKNSLHEKDENRIIHEDTNNNSDSSNIDIVDLCFDSDEKNSVQREQSNAFQILMNNTKSTPSCSPVKSSSQDTESSVKKREESKEKLKKAKEKLIALADKKGYSKRKLAEIEEGEKIDRTIENRIKAFKLEDKKDSNVTATNHLGNQRQSSGSLLNYFSKIPPELVSKDMATFIVKADVHMPGDCGARTSQKALSKQTQPVRRNKQSNTQFSDIDTIIVVASEDISVLNTDRQEECMVQQRSKRNWSLRIKLRSSEDENSISDESSEEIFSPRSRIKRNVAHLHKSEDSKQSEETNISPKDGNKKSIKQINDPAKIKLGKKEQDKIQDTSQNFKNNLSNSGLNKSDNNRKYTSIKNMREDQEDYMCVNGSNMKRKSNEKLAPLFTKKRKPNPEILAARRQFLQPENTENENKNNSRKANNACNVLPFPTLSHVTQLNDLSFISKNINIPLKREMSCVPLLDTAKYKCIINLNDEEIKPSIKIDKVEPKNIETVLTEIEQRCSGARTMWDNILMLLKGKLEKRSPSKVMNKKKRSTEKKENMSIQEREDLQGVAWTYKYKPMSTKEIVGNEEAAGKLKDWLDGWKATIADRDDSSGDEFYVSDCSYSSTSENHQVAVLLGPHGSGKSASVYAIAAELGYTVLEVNASSRRTGKQLLKQLEEATKSHRIKNEKNVTSSFKPALSEVKSKKLPQNSLILLEDIDLLFEEDEGFISATYYLASNTKRPIVMTCRYICPHLSKMAPQQNRIYFQSAMGNRVAALLELISLAESGYKLPQSCIAELLQTGDLRKAMLQLQYLLLSGSPQILGESFSTKSSFWRNIKYSVYKPAIKSNKKQKIKKNSKSEEPDNTLDVLSNLANKLDNIALISSLTEVEDAALNLSCINVHPSLSLAEDTSLYSASRSISSEIVNWVSRKTFSREQQSHREGPSIQNSFLLRKQLNTGVNLALSNVTSFLLDRKTLSVDYLPCVRTICRAEELRASANGKRGNRFFHYLHNLKVPTSSLKPNILAAACKVMQDKVNDMTR